MHADMKRDKPTSDKIELLGKNSSNSNGNAPVEPEVELPNQLPVTGEVPKTSAVCNATVKWKSRLSVGQLSVGGIVDTQGENPSSPKRRGNRPETPDRPAVVITAAGPQTNLRENTKETERLDGDNLSQNSSWTRHSRPGSRQGSRPGSRLESPSRPESRSRLASALLAIGTGSSFVEIPGRGTSTTGDKPQFSASTHVDNPLLAAIPYLPVKLAWVLLFLNIVVPGLGTILAGISMLCCGSHQQKNKNDELIGPCCVNMFVGISQLFTVTFLLVGWIWSITWGVYMVVFAKEQKRIEDEQTRFRRVTSVAKAFTGGRL